MREIVAGLFMSLDGVVEAPERWTGPYFDPEMGEALGASMAESDTILLGRRTYEEFAAVWPAQSSAENPVAGFMNETPKVVVSNTLEKATWQNSTIVRGDVFAALATLKQEPGRNIQVTGSVTLVRSLLETGLLDELGLMVHPVVLGGGQRLFESDGAQRALQLTASREFRTGVVSLTYRPTAG